jgi:toxin YoeB
MNMRNVLLSPKAFQQLHHWLREDQRMAAKIFDLIRDVQRDPFRGLGKPEPLRGDYRGLWSRRITEAHRLVYKVDEDVIRVVQCRFHYDK